MATRLSIFGLLTVILGVPFIMSVIRRPPEPPPGARTLLIVTPHIPQIRQEFTEAFERWHEREYAERVRVDMRTPGGTTEIRTQLDAQFRAEVRNGRFHIEDGAVRLERGAAAYDLMFGGGSYDHAQLSRGLVVGQDLFQPSPMTRTLRLDQLDRAAIDAAPAVDNALIESLLGRPLPAGVRITRPQGSTTPQLELTVSLSVPAGFEQSQLDEWFGDNAIGTQTLYDPKQYWIGTALSSFGIVYNRLLCDHLGVGVPDSFEDLTQFGYFGQIALADPRQSGSITTTFDSILGYYGWEKGWRILREMCANARSFSNASTKPPTDVSQGEAVAGLAIDFYGRGQAQAVGGDRVGYAEPTGAVYVDADPASILNGAANPDLARRFIEFVLTEEGQAIWQFRATTAHGRDNPVGPDGLPMGPRQYELRRMPVRRAMYEQYLPYMVDSVDPFQLASRTSNPGWRTGVQMMMGAFAIDAGDELKDAWRALNLARRRPDFPPEVLSEIERLFYAFPEQALPDGSLIPFDEKNYRAYRSTWSDLTAAKRAEIDYVRFFREQFDRIVDLHDEHSPR
ncbi:MAG: extracellular solute-binding protein [Leptolyngbya sp. PLA3]|nr:MAG: extracellular solute-binding protein [Cyanobacteria bacterium CYA]MCE7967568.1 extracellular solute-binding protein [Leptolyngbya sp. PL-A3]